MPLRAQKPPPAAEPAAAVPGCDLLSPEIRRDPELSPPADVRAGYVAEERRVHITWRPAADDVVCYDVVQTENLAAVRSFPGYSLPVALVPGDATGVAVFAPAGYTCYRVTAHRGNAISPFSNTACLDVPVQPAPPPVPPGDEVPDWVTRFHGTARLSPADLPRVPEIGGLVLEAYIQRGLQMLLCGATTVEADGSYSIDVYGAAALPGCSIAGDTVRFYLAGGSGVPLGAAPFAIPGTGALPDGVFQQGQSIELNLQRSPLTPPPVPPRP
jgi:hypothetical protein